MPGSRLIPDTETDKALDTINRLSEELNDTVETLRQAVADLRAERRDRHAL